MDGRYRLNPRDLTVLSVSDPGSAAAFGWSIQVGLSGESESPGPVPVIGMPNLSILDLAGRRMPAELVRIVRAAVIEGRLHVSGSASTELLPADSMADAPSFILQVTNVPNMVPDQSWIGFVVESGPEPPYSEIPPTDDGTALSGGDAADGSGSPGSVAIDYLARDYTALRTMMRGRLSANLPADAAAGLGHAADPMMFLVDVLAAAGDYLSYYQDAIGTEAYLGSARHRASVRRHARLLDFQLHEGCNARTWIGFAVAADVLLPGGVPVVTSQSATVTAVLPSQYEEFQEATVFFETMETARLLLSLNDLGTHLQGATEYQLPQGACTATLDGDFPELQAGRVVILIADPSFGAHAMRLVEVVSDNSAGKTSARTRLTWHPEDALPRPLTIPSNLGSGTVCLLGNVVLADHGRSSWIQAPELTSVPCAAGPAFHLNLPDSDLTFAAPAPVPGMAFLAASKSLSAGAAVALLPSATACLEAAADEACPALWLTDTTGQIWRAQNDLFGANGESSAFTAAISRESSSSGRHAAQRSPRASITLQFGDGVLGRMPPPAREFVTFGWRTGNGTAGNISAGLLTQVVTDIAVGNILRVSNPLGASGGTEMAPTSYGKLFAPSEYRRQLRGATGQDYVDLALRHPLVRQATAKRDIAAQSFTVTVVLEPQTDLSLSVVEHYLEAHVVCGTELSVQQPLAVDVDIALTVYCQPGVDLGSLRVRLTRRLGTGLLADGQPAFFHPLRFQLGTPVVLADVVEAILTVPGVMWVNTDPRTDPRLRFSRAQASADRASQDFEQGVITIGADEIVRAGGDSKHSEYGVRFYLAVER